MHPFTDTSKEQRAAPTLQVSVHLLCPVQAHPSPQLQVFGRLVLLSPKHTWQPETPWDCAAQYRRGHPPKNGPKWVRRQPQTDQNTAKQPDWAANQGLVVSLPRQPETRFDLCTFSPRAFPSLRQGGFHPSKRLQPRSKSLCWANTSNLAPKKLKVAFSKSDPGPVGRVTQACWSHFSPVSTRFHPSQS